MDVRLQNMFILLLPCFLRGILMINVSFPFSPLLPPPLLSLAQPPRLFFFYFHLGFLSPLPPLAVSAHLLPRPVSGAMGGLFLDGEDSVVLEDLSKWTVEDVCSFVGSLSGCAEYTQVMGPATPMYPSLCS